MASYKDIIPTFNPYIQQEPVEAMMKVGVYKQQRYDEGVKKIQESIDNIAGLDVVREVDKQYLQSKLNQLGGQLSSVAGGDFSNFQLVNSVNGMTNQIAKDPNVINAVSSAARYRKALESKDKLISEGKGSDSNDWLFNQQANKWLNSDDLKTQFNATYRPYRDYNKSARDIIKALGKKTTGYDVAFNEKGQLVDAITRVRIEGISKDRIQTALKQGLSPDDYRQMQTDGLYKYSNTSPEQYVQDLNSSYQNTFSQYSSERERLLGLQSSASSPKEKQRLQQQISQIDDATESLKSEYDSLSRGFESGDVQGSQAQLYTMNWFQDTANAFETQSTIKSYHTNPFAQRQFQRDQLRQNAEIAQAKLSQQAQYNKDRLEIERKKLKLMQDPYGSISIPTNKDATSQDVISSMEATRDQEKKNTEQLKNNFQTKFKVDGQDMTDAQFNDLVDRYQKYPLSVDWDRRQGLNEFIKSRDKLQVQDDIITRANDEADIIFDKELYESIPNEYKNLDINGFNVAEMNLLFREFGRKYVTIEPGGAVNYVSPSTGVVGGGTRTNLGEDKAFADYQSGKLTDEEYGLYTVWAGSKGSKQFKDEIGGDLRNTVNNLQIALSKKTKEIDEKKQNYIKDYYQKNYQIGQERGYRIPLEDAKQKDQFRPVLNSLALIAERSGGLGTGGDVSAEEIISAANELQSALVTTNSDGNYNIIITKTKGGSLTIPIGRDQYNEAFGGRFEASPSVLSFNERYLPKMLSTPTELEAVQDGQGNEVFQKQPNSFYTTAKDGEYETTLFNSFLHGPVDFPNVNYYGISGNIVSDGNPKESNQFKLKINIFDPVNNTLIQNQLFPAIFNKADLVPTLENFTDEAIWQLLNETQKKIPKEFLIELEEAAKAPKLN